MSEAKKVAQFPSATLTDVGRVRERNEDVAVADPKRGIFVLADGMGGHPDGNLAARIAADASLHYLTAKNLPGRPRDRGERLAEAIRFANSAILERSTTQGGEPGMGTTLAVAWFGKRQAHVAHVGDSRIYCVREGVVSRLTHDHTVVQALIDRGELRDGAPEVAQLGHILTQAVGLDPHVEPEVSVFDSETGDVLVLCSDGLSDLVPDAAIGAIVNASGSDLDKAAHDLVETALNAGGHDNVTVVVARNDQTQSPHRSKP